MPQLLKKRPQYLRNWHEIVGTLIDISSDDDCIYVVINEIMLSFVRDSEEASYISQTLNRSIIGRSVGILKTDLPERPLRIRLVESLEKA